MQWWICVGKRKRRRWKFRISSTTSWLVFVFFLCFMSKFTIIKFCFKINFITVVFCSFSAGPLSSHKLHQVTAGDSHTMALTIDGKVFIWGMFRVWRILYCHVVWMLYNFLVQDSHGQMGMFKEKEPCRTPTHLSSLNEPVISIASGNDHIVLISNSGKVRTIGS